MVELSIVYPFYLEALYNTLLSHPQYVLKYTIHLYIFAVKNIFIYNHILFIYMVINKMF